MTLCAQPPIHARRARGRLVADYLSSDTESPLSSPVRPTPTVPLNQHATPTRSQKRHYEADTQTPLKFTSSRPGAAPSKQSNATHTPSYVSESARPTPVTQPEMDVLIESEMRNAIFHDPRFVERFLPGDKDRLDNILEHCRTSDVYDTEAAEWRLPENISSEPCLYQPVLDIMNTIKRAVHATADSTDSEAAVSSFKGRWSRTIPSDEAEMAGIKPDLVLFEDQREHWESVRMTIEIKQLPEHHKAAIKQLARYARATFAHQIHRRHLYGLIVCGTEATFVRFDRAGILYSKRIDIRKNADAFTCAFASLLMLDRVDQGYDPAFTTRANAEGRLKYYIDLPECAFPSTSSESAPVAGPSNGSDSTKKEQSTRKLKVMEKLCHRKSICGRATIVLRVQEVLSLGPSDKEPQAAKICSKGKNKRKAQEMEDSEQLGPAEYVLKMIWRDPQREQEGPVLERMQGMFGLAQYVWHCDVLGRCHCSSPVEGCSTCVDRTVQVEGLMVCNNLRDIGIYVPVDDQDGTITHVIGEYPIISSVLFVC
jgi:hypothetical protein